MDYIEEQTTELDSLSYIFPDELTVMDQGPPATFRISCKLDNEELLGLLKMHARAQGLTVIEEYQRCNGADSDSDSSTNEPIYSNDNDDNDEIEQDPTVFYHPAFSVEFTYTPTYPDSIPTFTLVRVQGICAEDQATLVEQLTEHGTDSLGMSMIFAMVSHAKEHMERLLNERMLQEEHDREERILAEEEADRERYRGNTEEARMLQKSGAKLSISLSAALAIDVYAANKAIGKLTGRQMFERDKTLVSSDVQFMEEGDVVVDMELFEGLDIDDDSADGENEVLAGFTDDD
ncbi:hypothetical protein BASA60_008671 [Batrachochytrium salamandrivorans]|nr:hypothetical protein BASA60_008671 [Batrachochytrium salamandrivorans]